MTTMAHCSSCERPSPLEGSGELLHWRINDDGLPPTSPQCAARIDAEQAAKDSREVSVQLEADDQILAEMEKAVGWDRPSGGPPRPRPSV